MDLTGDLRSSLEAVRDRLEREIEDADSSSAVAALVKQLRETLVQIDGLVTPKGSVTDDLKRKRAQRQASVQKRSASGK